MDRDGTNILVIPGSRIDELEIESRRAGHDDRDGGER